MYQNAFYEVTPPSPYEVTPPPYEVTPPSPYEVTPPSPYEVTMIEDRNITYLQRPVSWDYVQEVRMQASIERFASFDEYMDIPHTRHPLSPEEEEEEEEEDDKTVFYDDEEYRFQKCGEIDGCYDYSEFMELETIVPEHEDYFLEDRVPMEIDRNFEIQDQYDFDYDYYNDPEYLEEMRIERMIDRLQDRF